MRSGAVRGAGALLHNFFESGLPGKHAAQRRFTPVTPSHSVTPNPDHLASLVPIDFLFDYIPVGAFWTILLIVHGRLPVALLGAAWRADASGGGGGVAAAAPGGGGRQFCGALSRCVRRALGKRGEEFLLESLLTLVGGKVVYAAAPYAVK